MQPDQPRSAGRPEFDGGVASRLGLNSAGVRPLRLHGSGLFLLPQENVVARLSPATDENRRRASNALHVTGWLTEQGFPTIEPTSGTVHELDDTVVTLWRYLAQPDHRPSLPELGNALGRLLHDLHRLPDPPFPLPSLEPLARLRSAIAVDAERPQPVLAQGDQDFLGERMRIVEEAYQGLGFPLGTGLVHNDAHIGNLLATKESPYGYVLGDWESVGHGPREVDVVLEGAPGNRFGEVPELREAFTSGYGYDLSGWSGWPTLRELRDLHSLAGHLRTADVKPAARIELLSRLESLKMHDNRVWHGVA
jgi:hypothetical protein